MLGRWQEDGWNEADEAALDAEWRRLYALADGDRDMMLKIEMSEKLALEAERD